MNTKHHRDGTYTYWSVYSQSWVRRSPSIPDRELAAMSTPERQYMMRRMDRRNA